MRLLLVLETRPETLAAIVGRNPGFAKLVRNRWLQAATLAPDSGEVLVFGARGLVPHRSETKLLHEVPVSADWYGEHLDGVRPARVTAAAMCEARG
jgi:hypothetical protein